MTKIKDILEYLTEEKIPFRYEGDTNLEIDGFSSLVYYKKGTLTWIGKANSVPENMDLDDIKLAVIQKELPFSTRNAIITEESKRVFFSILEEFFDPAVSLLKVGHGTYIGEKVRINGDVRIGHNCSIDGEITIEDGTVIYNNVSIVNKVSIGSNCVIQSGVVIGHDGFSYSEDPERNKRMIKHHGGVVIGNDVFIGSNTAIARGTIDDTIIGDGTKIDTLCHIAHNVHIGRSNALVTGTELYGSVHTGDHAYFASATVREQLHIGKDALVGMKATVLKDAEDGQVLIGTPAKPAKGKQGE